MGLAVITLVFLFWTWDCFFKPKSKPKEKTIGQLIDKLIEEQKKYVRK